MIGTCICGTCPSYTECMRADEEQEFCRSGRSADCIFDPRTCRCPSCPAGRNAGFRQSYYCIHGPENGQR